MGIWGWGKKRPVETPRLCPECNAAISVEDYHIYADLAICRRCNTVFHPSEYEVPGGAEAMAQNRGLSRIRVRRLGEETRISWYSGLRELTRFVSLMNTTLLGLTLMATMTLFIVLGFGAWTNVLIGSATILLSILVFEMGVASLVLPIMLLFAASKIVLKPSGLGAEGSYTGTYYRTRFFRLYQFPIDADSRVFLTLLPSQSVVQMGRTDTMKTLLTIRTDSVDGSFGEGIPENEKKVLAVLLWQYIQNLKVERGMVARRPDTDDRLRCPDCDAMIPLANVYPAEDVLVCDHCGKERPFPTNPQDAWLDELITQSPPFGLRIRNRSYGLWIRAGTWRDSILYGLSGVLVWVLSMFLFLTGSIWMVAICVRMGTRTIRKGYRWTIVLKFPSERNKGQMIVRCSHSFFPQKITWTPKTYVSIRSCYPSIQGPDVPTEIEVRTENQTWRFGREIALDRRLYIAAVLRVAIRGEQDTGSLSTPDPDELEGP